MFFDVGGPPWTGTFQTAEELFRCARTRSSKHVEYFYFHKLPLLRSSSGKDNVGGWVHGLETSGTRLETFAAQPIRPTYKVILPFRRRLHEAPTRSQSPGRPGSGRAHERRNSRGAALVDAQERREHLTKHCVWLKNRFTRGAPLGLDALDQDDAAKCRGNGRGQGGMDGPANGARLMLL